MKSIQGIRRYAPWHIWIEMEDDFIGRCGIADKYLDIFDVINFIDFPDADIEVRMEEKVGVAESQTAFLDIKSPVSGRIIEINKLLEINPSIINTDSYGEGWIFKIDVKELNEFNDLMDESRYNSFLEDTRDI